MNPFERGVEPDPLDGRHPRQRGLQVCLVLVSYCLRLEEQTDLRLQVGDLPSADTSKTSGYGRRIEVSRRQIHVSPS
jgi:hypothetical protein